MSRVHVGYVKVAGWGSDRHAREVRGDRKTLGTIRALVRGGADVVCDTNRGARRIIESGGRLYVRLPYGVRDWRKAAIVADER
jgi:hypothetical protein